MDSVAGQDPVFDYERAFSRNLGWVTEAEQDVLRSKRVAIAGLGGVGGSHLLTLTRLGIGKFAIADFDRFDLVNFNRQAGAMTSTLGRPKTEVMQEMALDINPELEIRTFPGGVDEDNLDDFLEGVDLYVDALDFFAFDARRKVFAACARLRIPAITAAPLGMGAALLCFLPGGVSFEDYFRLEGRDEPDQGLRFLLGLAPARLHLRYLADRGHVNLAEHRGPSTAMACQLCAGVAATQALKILLGRGGVVAAPHGLHFDAYLNRLKRTWRPGGNRHPLQRLSLFVGHRRLAAMVGDVSQTPPSAENNTVERILDHARWAPSGDNTQPWRFEILSDERFVVHAFDTRDHDVYDLDGRPSQIAVGALLETIRIASSAVGMRAETRRRPEAPDRQPVFDVELLPADDQRPNPLLPCIVKRSVQRRRMSRRPLSADEKLELEAAVAPGFSLRWLEGDMRRRMGLLWSQAGKVRMTTPEAFQTHQRAVAWGARFSADSIPGQALGFNAVSARIARWAMTSWRRQDFLNSHLGGTWLPRIELDLLPAMACGAHFAIVADHTPKGIDDYVDAGAALQRFWLTATRLDLQMQPAFTPLILADYARQGRPFSGQRPQPEAAQQVSERLQALLPDIALRRIVVVGRIGDHRSTTARSTRLSLDELRHRP